MSDDARTSPGTARPTVAPDADKARALNPSGFVGRVRHHNIATEAGGTEQLHLMAVYFDAGARTRPHAHPFDQFIVFVDAPGVVASDGGDDQIVAPGEFVLLPANIPHMHGATDEVATSHITFGGRGETDWECPIPDRWDRFREA